jgi:hypothetical protein
LFLLELSPTLFKKRQRTDMPLGSATQLPGQ